MAKKIKSQIKSQSLRHSRESETAQKVKISVKLPISVILSEAKNLDRTAVKRFFASLRMTVMANFLDFLRNLKRESTDIITKIFGFPAVLII